MITLVDFINSLGYTKPEQHMKVIFTTINEQENPDFKEIEMTIKNIAKFANHEIKEISIEDEYILVYIEDDRFGKITYI